MRVFAIHDDEVDIENSIGYLFYYERNEEFVAELRDDLNEWNAPLLFSGLVRDGIYTVPKEIARLWVEERIIPSGRQNIGIILRNAKLSKYNEASLLGLSNGKSSQDNCYVNEIKKDELPEWVRKRQITNVWESFPIIDNRVVCLLNNDIVLEVDLERCVAEVPKLYTVINRKELQETLKVDSGGYGISFNDSIHINKNILIKHGIELPIYAHVFSDFAKYCCINTAEACSILNCSRQNLAYMVKSEQLHPIKDGWRENVYLKGNITSME